MIAPSAPTRSRGPRIVATVMVILGAYHALGTLISPIGPDARWVALWLTQGVLAAGTAAAGIPLLQGRPGAAKIGIVSISAWLLAWVCLAGALGLDTAANPFTVGTTVFLLIALLTLMRR